MNTIDFGSTQSQTAESRKRGGMNRYGKLVMKPRIETIFDG